MAGGAPGRRAALLLAAATLLSIPAMPPGTAAPPIPNPVVLEDLPGIPDLDSRRGARAPTPTQRAAARGHDVRWNAFGTPATVTERGGFLATDLPEDAGSAARAYLTANRDLVGLSDGEIAALETVQVSRIGPGAAVLLRQRFGGVPAGRDGLVAVGVVEGKVAHVSSSLTAQTAVTNIRVLSPLDALEIAARDVGFPFSRARAAVRTEGGWSVVDAQAKGEPLRARPTAVPTYVEGVRLAWETLLLDPRGEAMALPTGVTHFIDAQTGAVIIRQDLVDQATQNPRWSVFPAYPRLTYASNDTREVWCWEAAPGCVRAVAGTASPLVWDVDPRNGKPSQTSFGNNARSTEKWFTNDAFKQGNVYATRSAAREYLYPWTNQWFEERCNPEVFESPARNDIDAAIANLFVGHNRMHDWSYHLGFTETAWNLQHDNFGRGEEGKDPEHGNAQAGGVVGGPPGFQSRDNANQITPPDGIAPTTNMYLWQPIPGGFYAPCVDGDFDMTVIAHEYTHAISNRMVAGPDQRLTGLQANAMGESWSDLAAMEILNEYGFVPVGGESPFAIGAYVTRDPVAGIRNYNMSDSPLNYGDVGYDLVGPQVHADGEIWSATNFDIRGAFNGRYGAGSASLQEACAEGEVPAGSCPGNYRWIQLVFDAWLLMANGDVTMIQARDAMLAADVMRFGGASQDLLWHAFARRGLGEQASTTGVSDSEPVPSFESPHADEGTLVFKVVPEGGKTPAADLFVGDYEARATPVADTDPATPRTDTVRLVPGTYRLLARAPGFGAVRTSVSVSAGETENLVVFMSRNLASSANGATAAGDGTRLADLIDDTEATNWESTGSPVSGKQVTVRLDPAKPSHQIRRVQVSAMLRPGQNRFSALRQFQILACERSSGVDCTQDAHFRPLFTSASDAFPAVAPRPRAPQLILRSFDVPQSRATHVRVRVVHNQCTGAPDYQGDLDDDPANVTDCEDGSAQDLTVRIAELQVFAM